MDEVCSTSSRSRRSRAESRRDRWSVRERQQERNRTPWSRARDGFVPRERLCSDQGREQGRGAPLACERAQTDRRRMARVIGNIAPVRSAVRVTVVEGVRVTMVRGVRVPSIVARRRHGSPAIEVMSDAARIDDGPEREGEEKNHARERTQGRVGASCERRGAQNLRVNHVRDLSPQLPVRPRPTSDPGDVPLGSLGRPSMGTSFSARFARAGRGRGREGTAAHAVTRCHRDPRTGMGSKPSRGAASGLHERARLSEAQPCVLLLQQENGGGLASG